MPEVSDLSCCKRAFVRIELELCVPETLEDLAEAGEVLLPGGAKDDNIVYIKEAGLPVETGEDAIHESGEGGWSVAEAKGYLVKLKELTTAGAEGRLLLVSFLNRDLPISALEAKSGEPAGSMECIEEVIDARNGMCFLYGSLVELPEVYTEP